MDENQGLKLLGKQIRKLREENKLTQAELAEKVGFSPNYIGMIERAERDTNISNIFKFANVFGIKPADLFDFE